MRAGRYEILGELGRGGFGTVYRARDPELDSLVAIKTLSVENDPSILLRFRNEAAASRRLNHPNIVIVYDFGVQDGTPFIVMQLLEGQDLQRVIESHRQLPLWHKLQIMTQVASGLAHAHAHGIVHRDVKPGNIMLLPDGNIKIMDFGIALVSRDTHSRLTPRGAVIGTFSYMAPEQFMGSQQDARSDIFAYGLVFYELLSGIHPFHAPEPAAAMYNTLNLEPVPIREVCPECPEEVQSIVSRLLQKDPEFRYQSLDDVLFDCEPILAILKRNRARSLFEEVKRAQSGGHIESALSLLRQVMELDASYPGARELREQLQSELRRSAVRPRVEALAAEARQQLAAGNPTEALAKFEAAIRLDPSDLTLKSAIEQAKAGVEQSRQVARLVAEAERALETGDLTGAHRIAKQVVELAPDEKRAREILSQTEATLAEQERQARLSDSLAKSRRLIEISSWDKASSLLDQLEREFPVLPEISALRETLRAGKLAQERLQRLSSELAAARQDIDARKMEAASRRLTALHIEFPAAAEVEQLLRFVNTEIETERQREIVDSSLSDARTLAEHHRFQAAMDVLQAALVSYPTHPVLLRELRSVTTALRQAEREAALEQALRSAKDQSAKGSFEDALALLQAFTSVHGPDLAVAELKRTIEREREAALRAAQMREVVLRFNHLLSQDKAEEATQLLEAAPTPIKEHPEITRLRSRAQAQIERRRALERALAEADAQQRNGGFDRARQVLAAFRERHGADAKVDQMEAAIQLGIQEAQRKELRRLISQAKEFLAQGRPGDATRLLQSGPEYLKDDPEVTEIFNAADLQRRQQEEREAALQFALSSAQAYRQQCRFEDGLAALDRFTCLYGPDQKIASLQKGIQSDCEAARRAALRQAVARAEAAHRKGNSDEALQILADFSVRHGDEPKTADLVVSIRRDVEEAQRRTEESRLLIGQAKEFLAQGKPGEATRLLQSGPEYLKDDPEVTEIFNAADLQQRQQEEREAALQFALSSAQAYRQQSRFEDGLAALDRFTRQYGLDDRIASIEKAIRADREAARCAALQQAVARAEAAHRKGNSDEALQILADFSALHGDDPKTAELAASIRRDVEAQRRAEELRQLIGRADRLLAEERADEVLKLLQSRPAYFGDTPEITKARAAAELLLRQKADREAALREATASAESLQKQGRFEDALGSLNAFVRRYGVDARVDALVQSANAAREAEVRRAAEIAELESRLQQLMARGEFEALIALVAQSRQIVEANPGLLAIANRAEAALAERKKQEAVAAVIAEAQARTARGEFKAALDAIDRGLKRFPLEAALAATRDVVLAAQAAKQREDYLAKTIEEVRALIAKHDYVRALGVRQEALSRLTGEPRLVPLREEIEIHQREWEALQTERKIQETVARADELLAAKPAESVALLERLSAQHPTRRELSQRLEEARQAVREFQVRALIREAERLSRKGKFEEAIAKIDQAEVQTPEVAASRRQIELRQSAVIGEQVANAIQLARARARRKPSQALRDLETLGAQFPHRPEIEHEIEICRQQALEQEQAAETARRAKEAEAASRAESRQREVKPDAWTLRSYWKPLAGLAAGAVLVAGVWWRVHSSPKLPSLVSIPFEVRTDPEGASVRIGDQTCITPNCRIKVPPGTYPVEARLNGYEPLQQNLEVSAGRPGTLTLTLRPVAPPSPSANTGGKLIVQAGMSDVLVFVDDVLRGRTDASGVLSLPLEAAIHYVRVEKVGYETGGGRRVTIVEGEAKTVMFLPTPKLATLELRDAPAGVEVRVGERVGRTDGSLYSMAVPPGDQVVRLAEGTATRGIQQRFEPGGLVSWTWANVAPQRPTPPPVAVQPPVVAVPVAPPKTDPAEQAWTTARGSGNPTTIQNYLDNYPGSRHTAEAQSLLDSLAWSRVSQNDVQSLRDYLNRFRTGVHAQEAARRIADLIWNSVNQKDEQALRAFLAQNPDSPYRGEGQTILQQLEKQRLDDAEAVSKAEQAKREAVTQAEEKRIRATMERFNNAFAKAGLNEQKQRALREVWPDATGPYLNAVSVANRAIFDAPRAVNVNGDTATAICDSRGPGPASSVKVTFRKKDNDWLIVTIEPNR